MAGPLTKAHSIVGDVYGANEVKRYGLAADASIADANLNKQPFGGVEAFTALVDVKALTGTIASVQVASIISLASVTTFASTLINIPGGIVAVGIYRIGLNNAAAADFAAVRSAILAGGNRVRYQAGAGGATITADVYLIRA